MKKTNPPDSAFDLERAVAAWTRKLSSTGTLEDGDVAELEAHLRDEVEALVGRGWDPREAFQNVTASVESFDAVGFEYSKIHKRGLFRTPPGRPGGFSPALFLNALKLSLRKMRRQKGYSLIIIAGLATGLACSFLILLWVRHELSFDRFHEHSDSIYRIVMEDHLNDNVSVHPWLPFPLGPALQDAFPEIAAVSRYCPDNMVVRYRDQAHTEKNFLTVDPAFFEIFSFSFLQGNPADALADPHAVVLRDTMVEKYFGAEDPMGKTLNLSGRADLTVSGIVHIPEESNFQFDFFFPFQSFPLFNVDLAALENNWQGKNYQIYILLQKESSPALLEKKIAGFLKARTAGQSEILRLQALSRIHLYNPDGSDGAIRYVRIFSLTAFFILLIACVNFMNLATARFEKRAREVALRKTLGGTRAQIFRQFLGESLLHSGLAMAAAFMLAELALPVFNKITTGSLRLELSHAEFFLGFPAIALLAGFMAGVYPAFFLSSFAPEKAFRIFHHSRMGGSRLRKFLVVFQFAVATLLITGTLTVKSQFSFMTNRNLGMAKDNVVYHLMQKKTRGSVEAVREELLGHPDIMAVSSCSHLPIDVQDWIGYLDWGGHSPERMIHPAFLCVDADFVKTAGLTVIQGRDFSRYRSTDTEAFLINETARRQLRVDDPLDLELRFWGHRGRVIGVVKDFTNQHMSSATAPLILSAGDWGSNRNYLLLRLRPGDPTSALRHFRGVWEKANPGFPSEYAFMDDAFNRMYLNEQRLSRILLIFTALAVFLSCLGLMGLSAFTAEEKTKEIGIRKVLGASSWKMVAFFSMFFAKPILVANALAWPAAYLVLHRWLQDYAIRTGLGIGVFALAGGLSLAIAWLSIGYQTYRAAAANPVDSLRYE